MVLDEYFIVQPSADKMILITLLGGHCSAARTSHGIDFLISQWATHMFSFLGDVKGRIAETQPF